jgi:hypothetical protein
MRVPTFALPERSVGVACRHWLPTRSVTLRSVGPRRGPIRHLSTDRADHDATVLPDLEPDPSEAARRGTGLVAEPEHAVLEPARLGGERDVVTAYAEAVLTKSPSLRPGCAFAVICTVTWLPAPSVGDVT